MKRRLGDGPGRPSFRSVAALVAGDWMVARLVPSQRRRLLLEQRAENCRVLRLIAVPAAWLPVLKDMLNHAVCVAYGWEYDVLDDEEDILRRLLALNLERA